MDGGRGCGLLGNDGTSSLTASQSSYNSSVSGSPSEGAVFCDLTEVGVPGVVDDELPLLCRND